MLIAIIPARGGSKRIPGKNIKPLFGKPAIVYTIEAAKESDLFSRIVVSTDNEQIAEIALQSGAEVPFLREASLADDFTPVSAVTLDMLNRLDPAADKYRFVAQLLSCCPLRGALDIVRSKEHFEQSGSEAQISVVRYGWQNPWWAMKMDSKQVMQPLFEKEINSRAQVLPQLFCPTGAIWWATAEALRREGTFHIPNKIGWEIPWQRGLDIDTPDDWELAETFLHRAMSSKGAERPKSE